MTARAIVPKLSCILLGLAALAWMPHARAVPEDREARAPRWATTDLACAEPSAPVPGCSDQRTAARTASGEALVSGYVTRAVAAAAAAQSLPSAPAAGKGSSQKASATPPSAPAKIDDYVPIVNALREVLAALGRNAGDEILLAFVARPVTARANGERLRHLGEMPATLAVVALSTFSGALPGSYQSSGARFDHVLFHAIDPERLLAWNVATPESASEGAARAPVRRSPGELAVNAAPWGIQPESASEGAARAPVRRFPSELAVNAAPWGIPGVGPERKSGEPNDKAVKSRRTIVYMEKRRTTVMTLEDPAGK